MDVRFQTDTKTFFPRTPGSINNHNHRSLKTTAKHLLNAEQFNATRREFRAPSGQTKKGGGLHINHNKICIIFKSKQETLTIHKTSLKLRKQNGMRLEFSLLN